MNTIYLEILQSRLEYFSNKKITELSDDEIKEFIALREEIVSIYIDKKELIKKIWDSLKPYYEASKKYKERVADKGLK